MIMHSHSGARLPALAADRSRARRLAKDLNDVHLLGQQCELFRQRTRADVKLVTESDLDMKSCPAVHGSLCLHPVVTSGQHPPGQIRRDLTSQGGCPDSAAATVNISPP